MRARVWRKRHKVGLSAESACRGFHCKRRFKLDARVRTMGMTSSSAARDGDGGTQLARTLPQLARRGFRLLALDFDMTIVDCHTGE